MQNPRISIPDFLLPIFLGTLAVLTTFHYSSIDLTGISDGIIGAASLDGIDVTARNKIFRNCLLLFLGIQGLWAVFHQKVILAKQWNEKEFYWDLKVFALLGSFGILFLLIGNPIQHSLNFLLTLFLFRLLWAIHKFFKPTAAFQFWEGLVYILGITLSLKLLPLPLDNPFNDLLLIVGAVGLSIFAYLPEGKANKYIATALSFLPITAFLGFELFQIGQQRGWSLALPICLLIASALFSILVWKKSRIFATEKSSWFKLLFPSLAIIGSIYYLYFGGLAYPKDLFELANPANSLHRLINFGEWPFIDFLSSHLLSEQIPGYLYALLNGFDGSIDFLVYQRCLEYGLLGGLGYLFLKELFDHKYLALGIVLLFPFYYLLIPKAFCLALLSPLLIFSLWKNYSIRKLILIGLLSIGLLFWKIDLGIANLIATLSVLTVFYLEKKSGQLFRQLIKITFAGLLLGGIIFGLIEWLTEGSLILNLKKTLSYFSAEQAHGRSKVSYSEGRLFRYHYFFFPVLVAATIPYFITTLLKQKEFSKEHLLWAISILYLSIFILINFPRGILRHSFISGNDNYLTSFLYLFLPLLIAYFFKSRWRPLVFLCTAIFFIHNFKFKAPEKKRSFFEESYSLLSSDEQFADWSTKKPRIPVDEKFQQSTFSELKSFLDSHFSKEATFLDLTNHPMLYFYTQRAVPSFFNQYLQNTANEELQLLNLDYLQQYDIPLVVYRSIPMTWLDATDDIPNTLRYLEVHNYIQQNYAPFTVLDSREIWLKKDAAKPRGNFPAIPKAEVQKFNFKKLPYLFTEKSIAARTQEKMLAKQEKFWITAAEKITQPQYLKIKLSEPSKAATTTLRLKEADTVLAALQFETQNQDQFIFPISWVDCWTNTDSLQLEFTPRLPIETVSLLSK